MGSTSAIPCFLKHKIVVLSEQRLLILFLGDGPYRRK